MRLSFRLSHNLNFIISCLTRLKLRLSRVLDRNTPFKVCVLYIMPRRRTWKPRMNRRVRRRRIGRRRGGRTTNTNRALQPIPQRYICKMKYAQTITTDANGQAIFRLNSVFQPPQAGGGHQPYAFDTLSTLYNRYRVISCGWRIHTVVSPTDANGLILSAIPSNDNSIVWNPAEMIENPRAKYVLNQAGGICPVLRGKSYIPSLMGRTKAQYMADDHYQSTVLTNPVENALLYILASTKTGTQVLGQPLQVLLEYTVEWYDVKRLLQS